MKHRTWIVQYQCMNLVIRLGLGTLIIPSLAACTSPSQASAATDGPPTHIEYFGFAIVDGGHDDPLDNSPTTNYAGEMRGIANIADIAAFDPNEDLTPRIDAMAAAGVRPILNVAAILLDRLADPGSPTGFRLVLRADAEQRLATLVASSSLDQQRRRLSCVYIADEPAWNRMSMDELARAAQLVRARLPDVPIALVEASQSISSLVVPTEVDWIGFNRYGVLDPANDPAWQADLAALLDARSRDDQRILIVMESQFLPAYAEFGVQPQVMAGVAWNTVRAALDRPEVVAIVGYPWPGGFDEPKQLGGRNLPTDVRQAYRDIFSLLIDR